MGDGPFDQIGIIGRKTTSPANDVADRLVEDGQVRITDFDLLGQFELPCIDLAESS